MIALLRKESAALLPYWVAFGVLIGFNLAAVLWASSFVEEPLGERFAGGDDNAVTLFLLSLIVGHGAVAHELRDGHVEFLDALPIGRGRIFASKVAACLLPCLVVVAASFVMDVGLAEVARPPHALRPLQAIVVMHLVMLGSAVGGLGLGMLLSWIGPLAWGVLLAGWFTCGCLGVIHPPILGGIPLLGDYGLLQWDLGRASHPVGWPLGYALVGIVAIVGSGLLFLGPGQLLTARGSAAVAGLRLGLGGCLLALLLPIGALVAFLTLLNYGGGLFRGVDVLPTEAFRVLYAPGDEERARQIAAEVDGLSAEVGRRVGNPDLLRLDIELLGAPQNHLGVYTGGKIRLSTDADVQTLAHELAHAHAYQLTGPAGWYQQNATHFFEEGLADWVQARIAGEAPVPPIAAAIWTTGQGRFEDLVDHERFIDRHDIRQSYLLGQAFVEALVDAEGPDAPGCLLRGVGGMGSRPVAGLALWYGLADACDVDLDGVRDRWEALLAEAASELPERLPRLRASIGGDPPVVRVRDELALDWQVSCGFRTDGQTPANRWVYVRANDGVCPVPLGALSGASYQYQVGFAVPPDQEAVFLEWTDSAR